MVSRKFRKVLYSGGLILLFAAAITVTVGPVYWVASSSLKPTHEIITPVPTAFPTEVVWLHYQRLFTQTPFLLQLQNSLVVAVASTLLSVSIVLAAAVGAYRGRHRWLRNLKFLAILVFVFPTTLLVVPIYQVLVHIGLVDTLWSLVAVNCMLTAPFSFWLIEGFLDTVPNELEDAAVVDGANRLQSMLYVVLPLASPGIAVIAIYTFVISWTEFAFSSVLIIDTGLKTLPMGLADILAAYNINWGLLTSNTTLAMVPGILFFALVGRHFISGLVSGALKA